MPKKSHALFVFNGNRIAYFSEAVPASVEVDGKPWTDLKKPFELDFVPDLATAPDMENVFDDGGVTMILDPAPAGILLEVENSRDTAIPLKFRMSMRTDKARTNKLKQNVTVPDASEVVAEVVRKKKPAPGRRELLPVLSPLRTVRAGFPAYGSSFYKALISQHPAFRMALSLGG